MSRHLLSRTALALAPLLVAGSLAGLGGLPASSSNAGSSDDPAHDTAEMMLQRSGEFGVRYDPDVQHLYEHPGDPSLAATGT